MLKSEFHMAGVLINLPACQKNMLLKVENQLHGMGATCATVTDQIHGV
jgi:hypothetical protein